MSGRKIIKGGSDKPLKAKRDRAEEIANIFEWLITAFILAFVFRAFVMEAFRIPTGSMADTLKGAHFRLRCRQCGYKYAYGFNPHSFGLKDDTIPSGYAPLPRTKCPSCGYSNDPGMPMPVANGDRILVLKCLYQFFEPKRWDVIVFKNPTDPNINYIKRLIGLPGEAVHIIDGDIYIDGQITRKPPKVQEELWMPIYNNDYQPVDQYTAIYNGNRWEPPFSRSDYSQWSIDDKSPTLFHLDSAENKIDSLRYNPEITNDFRPRYAYNRLNTYKDMPYCSDLMVRFYCRRTSEKGSIGISLSKYQSFYRAWIDFSGTMVITKTTEGGQEVELARKTIEPPVIDPIKQTLVKFSNVDHQLIFEYGDEKLTFDMGRAPEDAGPVRAIIRPKMEIFGSGKLTLSHVAVFRDIHYTSESYNGNRGRAADKPFQLKDDEYFVLGDNSPNSEDCRWWKVQGIPNPPLPPYRVGIVPRDYLVGKALFVYWPSGFRPFDQFPLGIIPNVGLMRFINGGSNDYH
jgi:signal peptidase I